MPNFVYLVEPLSLQFYRRYKVCMFLSSLHSCVITRFFVLQILINFRQSEKLVNMIFKFIIQFQNMLIFVFFFFSAKSSSQERKESFDLHGPAFA